MPDTVKLLQAIEAAESNSYGSETDSILSKERALSIQLYNGDNLWPVQDGRSKVVDRSVYETIQWILPSLGRIFAGNDDVVTVPPVGPEDEALAKQESQYLNWVITQKNDWFNIFSEWAMDALMTKNSYILARRESKQMYEMESYEKQTPEGLALLLQDGDVKIIESKQYPDPDYKPEPDPQTGQVMPPQMLFDVKVRRVSTDKCIKMYVLPPERTKVGENTPTWKLHDCDYFEWWEIKTLSQLRQDGFDVADDIGSDSDGDTDEDSARDSLGLRHEDESMVDPSMRKVKARFIWIRHDYDEDGIAEMQYVVVVGNTVLFREECSRVPVACIVPNPMPHRHMGLSIADTTADIQAIKTAILRQGLDNLYLANNPQKVVNQNVVNLDDAMISRPGGIVRIDGPAGPDNYRHETPPFVFPQALEGLEYMDQIRENRTGTNRYFTGIDQNAMNKTATGINQLTTMAAQRVEHIARIFASGVEDLASIVHELILKSGHKKEIIKIRNDWVEVDPSSWRKRTDFKISVGFAAGNKDAMINRLTMIATMQEKAAMAGLPIVTPQNMYETQIEIVKASDFSTPDRFWTNPEGVPPQQPQPDPALQVKQMELASAEKIKAAELAANQRTHAEDVMFNKYKTDSDNETKVRIAAAQLQDKAADRASQQDLADANADVQFAMEEHKAKFNPKLHEAAGNETKNANEKSLIETLSMSTQQQNEITRELIGAVTKVLTAPRKLVRDKAGRPVGSVVEQ